MSSENGMARNGERFIDLLRRTSLKMSDLPVVGVQEPRSLKINFYQDGKLTPSEGQFFVSMPEKLASQMRGSYISPDVFLANLKDVDAENVFSHKSSIIGDREFSAKVMKKAFEYREENFSLNVFHGSTNPNALELTEIARELTEKDLDHRLDKIHYQDILAEIVEPIIKTPSKPESPPAIKIVEDCLASGDTIIGVLAALQQKTKLTEMTRVRVDVAVATAQGILLLRKFAQDNGIDLELNVGYMAFGLSKGKKTPGKGYEHSNYITYPDDFVEELNEQFSNGFDKLKNRQVVGDMGENGQKVEGLEHLTPWYQEINKPELRPGQYPVMIFLANGGYLMRGYTHYFLGDEAKEFSEVIFSAKRRHDEGTVDQTGLGYGVLLYDMPDEIFA